jgi:hypothetical protein
LVPAIILLVLATVLYLNFFEETPESGTRTEPDAEPVVESPPPQQEQMPPPAKPQGPAGASRDSLKLFLQTSDSVWFRIIIDSRDSLEFMLRPNVSRTWVGRESFLVSIGRPDAIELVLNGVPIMRDRGMGVIHDTLLTHETLARLSPSE